MVKKKRFIWNVLICFVCVLTLMVVAVGCNKNNNDTKPNDDIVSPDDNVTPPADTIGMGMFPIPKMNSEKKLIVFGNHKRNSKEMTVDYLVESIIQGFLNRESVNVYLDYVTKIEGKETYKFWLERIKGYGITVEEKTTDEAVEMYKQWAGDNAGYILYSDEVDKDIGIDKTRSLTAAVNLAAIKGWIPIEEALVTKAEGKWGLVQKSDVRDLTEKDIFNEFKDEFDNSILIQQRPEEMPGYPLVALRDYAVCHKYFTFFEPEVNQSALRFRNSVHDWAKQGYPILGWGPGDEASHISFATKRAQYPIPADNSYNLTVMNADIFAKEKIEQKNKFEPITPQEGKHYVAFGRSDGDNISVWTNEFPISSTDIGGAKSGKFPMGWSMSPSLMEIAPLVMKTIYDEASPNDYFIAPVSGHGYMYPSSFPVAYREKFIKYMDKYLGFSDLSVVEILDHGRGNFLSKDIANLYASAENLKGGICLNGPRYAGGHGAVIWSDNGKPFIHPRETLWEETKEILTGRINSYQKNYKTIEGYTFVNLHPWTHSYQDVQWVVDNLDDDVVVISPEQMIDLISKNVPHNDVNSLQPSTEQVIVPIDPLYNKFIINGQVEDWKGVDGGSVKAQNKWLTINKSAIKDYQLPDKDNLWISLDIKNAGADAKINIQLQIGEKNVDVVKDYTVRVADGSSPFYIPLDSLFDASQYKNKQAKLKIIITNGNSIKITNVMTYVRDCEDKTSVGDPFNDSFDSSYEDWYLGGTFTKLGGHAKKSEVRKYEDNGEEYLILDGSDAWTGMGKSDADVNTSIIKYVKIPDWSKTKISFDVYSSDMGTLLNVYALMDGRIYDFTNGWQYIEKSQHYDLSLTLPNTANKYIQLVMLQRDSWKNSGIGECVLFNGLSINQVGFDELHNTFDTDLEDWKSENVTVENGKAVFNKVASMNKTITLPKLDSERKTQYEIKYTAQGNISYKLSAIYDDNKTAILQDWVVATGSDTNKVIKENVNLQGKTVKLVLQTKGEGTLLLDSFDIASWQVPASWNNTFEKNNEDWSIKSTQGNIATNRNNFGKDPNWKRLQIIFDGANGKTVIKKNYTLPDSQSTKIEMDLDIYKKTDISVDIIIDGETYNLGKYGMDLDNQEVRKVETIVLSEKLQGVEFAGKNVEINITFVKVNSDRAWIWSFVTKEA